VVSSACPDNHRWTLGRAGSGTVRIPKLPVHPARRPAARLITAGHALAADGARQAPELLAGIYTLTTRTLIKLDDQQISWMTADRARVLATGSADPLLASELAVLARKAGWYEQAISIALGAAAAPGLAGNHPQAAAERGLLIQSAAYTAARAGDRDTMRATGRMGDGYAA
jgi:hypothetical protein